MRGKTLPSLQSLMTFVIYCFIIQVLLEDDKLIGVSVSYDLLDTFKMPTVPNQLEFLKKLAKVGKDLEKTLDIS